MSKRFDIVEWETMQRAYVALQVALKGLRDKMRKLTGGRYRPQAVLRNCHRCGDGPYSARELRLHKCKKAKP